MSMTEETPGPQPEPEAVGNRSSRTATVGRVFARLTPLSAVLLIAGLAGAALMVAAEFSTLRSVTVLTAPCSDLADPELRDGCAPKGHEQHAFALVLLGIAAAAMTFGAMVGRSRPAAVALAVIGGVVLFISLALDLPDATRTGVIGERFDQARADAGPGLWMEIAGGALVFAAGVAAVAGRLGPERRRREIAT